MDGLRWMSVEQIHKQQRMRRERVIEAMLSGELPYEQRGRIRYARTCDVEAWGRSPVGVVAWLQSESSKEAVGKLSSSQHAGKRKGFRS